MIVSKKMRSLLLLILSSYVVVGLEAVEKQVGCLVTKWHNIKGKVFIKNSNQLFIENFNYDGQGRGVYFNFGR